MQLERRILTISLTLVVAAVGCTPSLHTLIRTGAHERALAEIQKSQQVDSVNHQGETPLHDAARYGATEVGVALIEHGADVNAANPAGYTPLHLACGFGATETARMLISHGANLELLAEGGRTPLLNAIPHGHTECAALLIESGANVEARSSWGIYPLMAASASRNAELVGRLLAAGARPDEGRTTPLMLAARGGDLETCRLLLEAGADPNALSAELHVSPLHFAAANGHPRVAHYLIESGATLSESESDAASMEATALAAELLSQHLGARGAEGPADQHCTVAARYFERAAGGYRGTAEQLDRQAGSAAMGELIGGAIWAGAVAISPGVGAMSNQQTYRGYRSDPSDYLKALSELYSQKAERAQRAAARCADLRGEAEYARDSVTREEARDAALIAILGNQPIPGMYTPPAIPDKKLRRMTEATAVPDDETVLGVFDATLLGTADAGFVVGRRGLYVKNRWTGDSPGRHFIPFDGMQEARVSPRGEFNVCVAETCISVWSQDVPPEAMFELLRELQGYVSAAAMPRSAQYLGLAASYQ